MLPDGAPTGRHAVEQNLPLTRLSGGAEAVVAMQQPSSNLESSCPDLIRALAGTKFLLPPAVSQKPREASTPFLAASKGVDGRIKSTAVRFSFCGQGA